MWNKKHDRSVEARGVEFPQSQYEFNRDYWIRMCKKVLTTDEIG